MFDTRPLLPAREANETRAQAYAAWDQVEEALAREGYAAAIKIVNEIFTRPTISKGCAQVISALAIDLSWRKLGDTSLLFSLGYDGKGAGLDMRKATVTAEAIVMGYAVGLPRIGPIVFDRSHHVKETNT